MRTRPKSYVSYADFVREEVRPMHRVGFCMDDLEAEATYRGGVDELDESEPEDLDFGVAAGF